MAVTQLPLEIFDKRQCILGEGPVSSGANHSDIQWVDIEGKKVLSRNLESGQASEYEVAEHIGLSLIHI